MERHGGRRIGLVRLLLRQHRRLGHSTWRHVKFVEGDAGARLRRQLDGTISRGSSPPTSASTARVAGCLEACPTGALVRTEFGGVFLQPDICNGCGYCVVSCPFGVVQKNPDDGRAFKCTFCMTGRRLDCSPHAPRRVRRSRSSSAGFPNCEEAANRLDVLHGRGMTDAQIYDPQQTSVKGTHSIFVIRGEPPTYNLPPNPEVPTVYLKEGWMAALFQGAALLAGVTLSFLMTRRSAGEERR